MKLDEQTFNNMIKARSKKNTVEAFNYFWASFVMQIIVYALLSHVTIKYWGEQVVIASLSGIVLYIPFTIVLLKKYKGMAIASGSINAVISRRIELLESFYKFKTRYELVLIPLICLIGTYITFRLYVPGLYINGMLITFGISLASCVYAIRRENKKSFDIPLSKLRLILADLNS